MASPSFAPNLIGHKLWLSKTCGGKSGLNTFQIPDIINLTYLASPHPVSGLHIWPSPIIPSAKWASGARSPLAPTVPCSGTHERHEAEESRFFYKDFLQIIFPLNKPLKASMSCFRVGSDIPEYPFARTFIRSASNIRVFCGLSALPTPAAWDLIKFSWSSLNICKNFVSGR